MRCPSRVCTWPRSLFGLCKLYLPLLPDFFFFYLFDDDTNLLFSNKDLKDLEKVVNDELTKVGGDWLDANQLSLNTSKSNFVISHPYQHKPDCNIQLEIYNNNFKKVYL